MNAPDLQQRLNERLSDQDVADFQRDGAVCIRQLLTPGEVALLKEGMRMLAFDCGSAPTRARL